MTRLAILVPLMVFACCGDDKDNKFYGTPCTCPIDRWDIGDGMYTYYAEEFTGECEFLRDSFFDDGDIPFGYCESVSSTPNCKDGTSGYRKADKEKAASPDSRTRKEFGQKPLTKKGVKSHDYLDPPPLPNSKKLGTWLVMMQTDESILVPVRLFLLEVSSPDVVNPMKRFVGIGREVTSGGKVEFTVPKKYVTSLEPPTPDGTHWEYDVRLGSTLFHVLTTSPGLKIDSIDPEKVSVNFMKDLTIKGWNFGTEGVVAIAGIKASVKKWEEDKITVMVAKESTAIAGSKRVVVRNGEGDVGETALLVE